MGGKSFAPFQLIKKEIARMQVRDQVINTNDYSRGIKLPKRLAPARTHKRASFLILSKITGGGVLLCLKTLAFRSVHNSQATRRVRVEMAFRLGVLSPVNKSHQCWKDIVGHVLGSKV